MTNQSVCHEKGSVVYSNSAEFDVQPWLYVAFQSTLTAMGVISDVWDTASPRYLTIGLIVLVLTVCWRDGEWQKAEKCSESFWSQVF